VAGMWLAVAASVAHTGDTGLQPASLTVNSRVRRGVRSSR